MKKRISFIALLALTMFLATGCFEKPGSGAPVNLLFYGMDDSDVISPIISKYTADHPNVNIRYKKFNDPASFENLVVNQIAEGEGPDIFYLHNTWLPRHSKKLVPLQSTTFTTKNFSDAFVNVAADDFIQPDPADGQKKIYAMPLYVDTLALYYNKRDFEQKIPERGKPAPTWDLVLQDAAKLLTQDPATKQLKQGEIALGRADNIRLAADILYHLWLQGGVNLYSGDYKNVSLSGDAQKYFDYFLSFAQSQGKNYSWSGDLASPQRAFGEAEAFLSGKVSAILAYSDLYNRLDTELKNAQAKAGNSISKSDVAVAPSPQMETDESKYKVWANYYGLAVSRNSKNAAQAWDFIQYATSQNNLRDYHKATHRPASRRDLIAEQKKEPVMDVFVSQVGYAGSFRIFSDQEFAGFLREAITAAAGGQTSRIALTNAQTKMNDLMRTEAPEGLYPAPKRTK